MSRSIRVTLLGWYAVILFTVLAVFGGLVYRHRHRTAFERLDAELRAHASALAACVEWEPGEGFDLEAANLYLSQLDTAGGEAPYAVVLDGQGRPLTRTRSGPERAALPVPGVRDSDCRREVTIPGPHGSLVLAGRATAAVERDLAAFLGAVVAGGAGTLLLSLAGGFFLTGRVMRPIRRMTATAARIEGGRRSERIDVDRTEVELTRLGQALNAAFDRMEDALDRQTRFTADASHELRTPLSVMISNAECGLRRDRGPEDYREALETCLRAARRMTGVVEGLLTLARSDAGRLELRRESVDLRAVLEEVVAQQGPPAEERGIRVGLGNAAGLVVPGDAERLRDAIGNIVANGIRYNRDGGRVDVSLSSREGQAVLVVADTGVGIPAGDLQRVFERFYRVDVARSRAAGGCGLGLPIARWIIEAHGGTVSLESREGSGTTATIRLPLAPEARED
jgi:heavy metal sensor kinase